RPRSLDREGLRRGQRRRAGGRERARPGQHLRRLVPARGGGVNDRRRILVCDEEPQIVRALRVILRDAGFEAVPASSGEEALDLVAVRPPQAAILDLMLPDIDGVEVTRRIREWSEMPIVVLSAVGEEDRKVE